jgi:hypothetical protein
MAAVARFLRHTPIPALRAYFQASAIGLPDTVDWAASDGVLVRLLLAAVEDLDEAERVHVLVDAERVTQMAEESGQAALFAVSPNYHQWPIGSMESNHERTLWVYLNDPTAFRHAEEALYADHYRLGRSWGAYVGPIGIPLVHQRVAEFERALQAHFRSANTEVDMFTRARPTFENGESELVQLMIYREGLPDSYLEFRDGSLTRGHRRPVHEVAITYESATGVIEVVAAGRESRDALARLFATVMLQQRTETGRLPLRRYDLSSLLGPRAFPTDPEDGIASVRLVLLRVEPIDQRGVRATVEATRFADDDIHEAARQLLSGQALLDDHVVPTQAKLSITFYPELGARRGKVMSVTITMPNGCDLKNRTERERMVGEKYLERWGLVRDL